jgi:hypothetical protein
LGVDNQKSQVGVFGMVSSLVGMWVTENKLNVSESKLTTLGLVRIPEEEGKTRTIVRMHGATNKQEPATSSSSSKPPSNKV